MAEYIGRTGSCTEGRFHPDTNLTAYARSNGFQTALIGAKFKGTNKIYTYWGHTGMRRGDYAKVLVPREFGARQEEVVVRIVAVIPAAELKQANGRTAKHIQSVLIGHIPPSLKIPLPSDPFTQSWRNAAALDVVPAPMTEHARKCVSEINDALKEAPADSMSFKGNGTIDAILADNVLDMKVDVREQLVQASARAIAADLSELETQYYAHMRSMTQQDFYKQYMHDWQADDKPESRKDLRPARIAATTPARMGGRTYWDSCPNQLVGKRVDFILCDDLGDEEMQASRNKQMTDVAQAMSAAPPAKLQPFNPDVYTKENILMSKIETVVYVTLPGSTGRYTAESVTKEQYFNAIAQLERQIETLEKVKHKPASLHQEIEDLNKQIDDLGKLCDLYYAKKEPTLGQAEQSDAKDSAGDASSYIAARARD
jgi:hypothetical protein